MILDGARADAQMGAHFAGRVALLEHIQNLAFAAAQRIAPVAVCQCAFNKCMGGKVPSQRVLYNLKKFNLKVWFFDKVECAATNGIHNK